MRSDRDLIFRMRSVLRRAKSRDQLDSDGYMLLIDIESKAAAIERGENA